MKVKWRNPFEPVESGQVAKLERNSASDDLYPNHDRVSRRKTPPRTGRLRWRAHHQRRRRVAAQPSRPPAGVDARFIVTDIGQDAPTLYEDLYGARGEMENRIKEQLLDLFADRTSCHAWWANQLQRLLSGGGLRAAGGVAGAGAGGHRSGAGDLRDDPAEVAQDRRGGGAQHATGALDVVGSLSLATAIRASGAGAGGRLSAATAGCPRPIAGHASGERGNCAHNSAKSRSIAADPHFSRP